jgi:UTP--glucose-1-phosphate uridylyltransferase
MKPIRKAVLPVAGLGTRVLPATKSIPKEMLPVFDRPAIQYVVDEAIEAGIEHFVFVTGRNKGAIEDYFDRAYELEATLAEKGKTRVLAELDETRAKPGSMSFVRQQAPLGLGHAIWCARDVIGHEPFAILLPDMIVKGQPSCLSQLVSAYNTVGGNIIAVEPVDPSQTGSFGIVDVEPSDKALKPLKGMVEKPAPADAPSNLMITGRYLLQPEIFELLEQQKPGAGGEVQLTDSLFALMAKQDFHALAYDGCSYDCGNKIGYLEATLAHALADKEFGAEALNLLKAYADA